MIVFFHSAQAEELIKQEMLTMLRYDLVHHPPAVGQVNKGTLVKVNTDLEANPLEPFNEEELQQVCWV